MGGRGSKGEGVVQICCWSRGQTMTCGLGAWSAKEALLRYRDIESVLMPFLIFTMPSMVPP